MASQKRTTERRAISLPARLMWRDQRGTQRFASVVTKDMSEFGVFVECQPSLSIPLFRLVQFQLERDGREFEGVPDALRSGARVLSAVYRVAGSGRTGGRSGLALRLMIDPKRRAARVDESNRATA